MNTEALIARLLDLEERRAHIDEAINGIKAQLLAESNPGDTLRIGDTPVLVVTQRRTFNEKAARDTLPPTVIEAATVAKIDGQAVKRISPALWESCCTLSEPYLTKARG